MTENCYIAPEGANPVLSALRDGDTNIEIMRECVLSPRAYAKACADPYSKLYERLPICFNIPTEMWEVKTEGSYLIYLVERQKDGSAKVRWIKIWSLLRNKFEDYVFPQRGCTENTLVID